MRGQVIMGSDAPPEAHQKPQGFYISLLFEDPAEAERTFHALAQGGAVVMPIAESFWSERFGMLVDRYGTPWMINGGQRS
jgi:PhnB protein